MEAKYTQVSLQSVTGSKAVARRRLRPSQAKVRSMV